MTVGKKAVPKELLDSLLADYRKPEDLIGENGLLKQLTKLLVEKALEAEMCPFDETYSPDLLWRIATLTTQWLERLVQQTASLVVADCLDIHPRCLGQLTDSQFCCCHHSP